LPPELSELAGLEFDLSWTGFEPDELAAFLASPTGRLTDRNEAPELSEDPITEPGDPYKAWRASSALR